MLFGLSFVGVTLLNIVGGIVVTRTTGSLTLGIMANLAIGMLSAPLFLWVRRL